MRSTDIDRVLVAVKVVPHHCLLGRFGISACVHPQSKATFHSTNNQITHLTADNARRFVCGHFASECFSTSVWWWPQKTRVDGSSL